MGSTSVLVAAVALHLGAITAAMATRVTAGSRAEGCIQLLFLIALSGVGLNTWCWHCQDMGLAIPSAMTLTLTVIVAVGDFRRTYEPASAAPLSLHG